MAETKLTDREQQTLEHLRRSEEQKMGLAGAAYLTNWLMLTLGPRKAREVLLLGEVIDGVEAVRIGLMNKAVPPEQLAQAGEFA